MAAAPATIVLPPTGTTGTASPAVETIDTTGSGGPQRQVVAVGDWAGSTNDVIGPIDETAPSTDTSPSGQNGRLQRIAQNVTSMSATLDADMQTLSADIVALGTIMTTVNTSVVALGTIMTTVNTNVVALATALATVNTNLTTLINRFPTALTNESALHVGGTTLIGESALTRPANTTAYGQGDLIASNVAAGSIIVPGFIVGTTGNGGGSVRRLRLISSGAAAMSGVAIRCDLWEAAPTFTNGDGGTYAVAAGSTNFLGSVTFPGMIQAGDGAYAVGAPDEGSDISYTITGAGGSRLFWTLACISAAGFIPISGQEFLLYAEVVPD